MPQIAFTPKTSAPVHPVATALVPSTAHLEQFRDYIHALHRWTARFPELATEPDVRYLIENFPLHAKDMTVTGTAPESLNSGNAIAAGDPNHTGAGRLEPHSGNQARLFGAVLSAVTDFIYAFDRDGRFIYVNKALLNLWRLPNESVIGKDFHDLKYPREIADRLLSQIHHVFGTGTGVSDETTYSGPGGDFGYYEYIFNPVFAADGSVEAVAGSTRNITERKRHELNLAFLTELQQVLAPLSSSQEIMARSSALIAAKLRTEHCLLVEINETADEATVLHDCCTEGAMDLRGKYQLGDFHSDSERVGVKQGQPIVIDDVRQGCPSAALSDRFIKIGIEALVTAGYLADGRWKFALSAQKANPWKWRQEEIELLKESAARIYLRLERARADESLRESEARFRSTFENTAIGMAQIGVDGRWLRANQAILRMTGYSWDELCSRTFAEITHPDDLDNHLEHLQRSIVGEISTYAMEKRYLRKDGSTMWAHLSVSLVRDAAGQPLHFISALEDITARREASAELDRQRRFVERLTHVMPNILYVFDIETRSINWINRPLGLAMGYTPAELEEFGPDPLQRLMHPKDFARIPAHLERIAGLPDGEAADMEYRLRHRQGEWRWFRSSDTPFARNPDGTVRELIGTTIDVTERRKIVEALHAAKDSAEAANSSKDRFLAVLSHELRTPLTPVLMTAAALRADENLPADLREQIGMIERNVTLEARLIDDLLDLTRIANGKLTLRSELCDVHLLVGLVIEMVRRDARQKNISIQFDLAARRSHLTGDAARLQQVVWNLLRNAVKFTRGRGHILVRTFDLEPDAGADGQAGGEPAICVEVSDDGVGFAPEDAARILEPFEQAERGSKSGGLGLGLAIARAIVDMHRGRIEAQSSGPGQGATFLITLPGAIDPVPDSLPAPPSNEAGAPANDLATASSRLRLLVVEDHEPTLMVLARLLTRHGHHVTAVGSLAAARTAAAAQTIDLVLSDLGLPDGTGIELMLELSATYGLRGIALSGYGTEEDRARTHAAGFMAHLVKPVDINELLRALQAQAGAE